MSKPTKEEIREWQKKRNDDHTPPPTPEDIRRELGWDLLSTDDKQKERN